MKELLKMNYGIQVNNKVRYNQIEGYQDSAHLYFIIPSTNKETIHMEQAALAYYLSENGYNYVALPITTLTGEWFQVLEDIPYMVLKVEKLNEIPSTGQGKDLANFHQLGSNYQYEPQEISSYGQWKNLWINKLTAFEKKIEEESLEYQNDYYRLVMDMLPYLVGISENSIQYMQETESEHRYHLHDQGTIAFRRYQRNFQQPIVWAQDLVYDHPSRDLAEFIRQLILSDDPHALEECRVFIQDYQSVRPLSVFSWRLLYARLVNPIHIYDCLEDGFLYRNFEKQYQDLNQLLQKQARYEQRLAGIFDTLEVDYKTLRIPVLHWL